jgi:hypothetical protein
MYGDTITLKGPDGTNLGTRTETGVNPDGSIRYHHIYDGPEGGGILLTGPIAGAITLADGSAYDVTPGVIHHLPGHAGPILHHIEKIHESLGGVPVGNSGDRQPFTHTCTEACGAEATPAPPA